MATFTVTRVNTLPDSADKTDFYNLVATATVAVTGLGNADLASDAAIVDTKLAQITSTDKVSGKSFCNLASIPSGAGIVPKANIETTTWTDRTSLASITGWSAFTSVRVHYKKVFNTVFCSYHIAGTSNSTEAAFMLPDANVAGVFRAAMGYGENSGSQISTGYVSIGSGTAIVSLFNAKTGSNWTGSGDKVCSGQFFYEAG